MAPEGRMNDPNVISIGDDFRRYPREHWGTRDRVRAAREDRVKAMAEGTRPGVPAVPAGPPVPAHVTA
jgi:hypothetical protein